MFENGSDIRSDAREESGSIIARMIQEKYPKKWKTRLYVGSKFDECLFLQISFSNYWAKAVDVRMPDILVEYAGHCIEKNELLYVL